MNTPKPDERPKEKITLKFLPITHEEATGFVKSVRGKKGFRVRLSVSVKPFHFAIGAWDESKKLVGIATVTRTGWRDDAEISELFNILDWDNKRKCEPSLEDQLRNKCNEAWKILTGGQLLGLPGSPELEAGKSELDYIAYQETKEERIE